jgi:alginate O-acetyltransferase complex protein AlgI
LFWGPPHCGGLPTKRWWRERQAGTAPAPPAGPGTPVPPVGPAGARWIGRIVTFHLVCLGWVFFRADSFGTALEVLGRIVAGTGSVALNPMVVVVVVAMLASQLVPQTAVRRAQVAFSRMPPVAQGTVLAAVLTAVAVLGPEGVAPFIYFQF